MSTPNLIAAREAFARRVADAYLLTWQGFGYVGDEFSQERAQELGVMAATNAFPFALQPMLHIEHIDRASLDDALADMKRIGFIALAPNAIVKDLPWVEAPSGGYPIGDDGVVGD